MIYGWNRLKLSRPYFIFDNAVGYRNIMNI